MDARDRVINKDWWLRTVGQWRLAVKSRGRSGLTAADLSGCRRVRAERACRLCGAACDPVLPVCTGCEQDLPWIKGGCRGCGLPLPARSPGTPLTASHWRCGDCLKGRWSFAAAWTPFRYQFPFDVLIRSLKFSGDLAAAAEMAALMLRSDRPGEPPGLLVPVPLSDSRLRSRGFNQALELARHLGRGFGVEVREGCVRRRDTAPQSSLAAAARRENVNNAFVASSGGLRGQHVAIIDDVVTTGHTVQAMARALRRAGARRVEVWAVARAIIRG